MENNVKKLCIYAKKICEYAKKCIKTWKIMEEKHTLQTLTNQHTLWITCQFTGGNRVYFVHKGQAPTIVPPETESERIFDYMKTYAATSKV